MRSFASAAAVLATAATAVSGQTALFAVSGEIQAIAAPNATASVVVAASPVAEVFGQFADGRAVVGAGSIERGDPHEITRALSLRIVEADGTETAVAEDVLRAYPAPVGDDILFITANRDSRLWDGSQVIDLGIDRRACHFAWWPDASEAALTCFDSDWTEQAQSNPSNTAEFLRMNNNDIYRLDIATHALTPLVIHPEADWSPAISPDGTQMLFNSTRLGGHAAMFLLTFATGDISCLQEPQPELGYDENLPVSLVGQVLWAPGGEIIYATSRPDESHEIWHVNVDGSQRQALGRGSHPQIIGGGAIAYQTDAGSVATVTLPEVN